MMKMIWMSALFCGLLISGLFARAEDLDTVDHVDLDRYMGKWYEIASIPQYFQRKCVSNTSAEYSLLPSSEVKVYNSCTDANNKRIGSEGRARVEDPKTNAKLKVTFANIGERYFYLIGGKYWIIELDEQYRYVIVGHPRRTYGWILSRTPALPQKTLKELSHTLIEKGYDTCEFMVTPQKGGADHKTRLCDYAPLGS